MPSARVPNFLPSMSGFHFPNAFSNQANVSDLVLTLPVIGNLPLGNPSNGLCGGFVFAVMDFFTAQPPVLMLPNTQLPSPPQSNPATPGDPLFNYLLQRLLDTFVLGLVGPKTLLWMTLPTHGTVLSSIIGWLTGGVQNNIAWLMVNQEWPAIQSDLDSGLLSPLGLVTNNLATCHQVLAHGYDLDDQNNLTIYCYNPNEPSQDGVATLFLNIGQSYNTIPIEAAHISQSDEGGGVVYIGFFRASYSTAHAAATIIGPFASGQVPSSALALQPLAPQWNAWESPFSTVCFAESVTIQSPTGADNLAEGPYTALDATNSSSTPSVCSWGQNRVDLFIQDQLGFADHLSWDNGTVGIDQLQQSVVSCPCAVSWGSGRVDAFAVLDDLDYSLVHFWLDGGNLQQSESLGRPFGNWNAVPVPLDGSAESALLFGSSTGLYFASPPCVCSWGPNRLDVFAVANRGDPQSAGGISVADAAIAHLTFNGSWSRWEGVPPPPGANVAEGSSLIAVSWAPGRIDLFFVTFEWELLHAVYTLDATGSATWSAWENLGAPAVGFATMQPSVVSWGSGSLDVFGVGLDGNLYHQWFDSTSTDTGNWASAWENLGQPPTGGLQGSPAICTWAEGRLDVFARGSDVDANDSNLPIPALWHLYFDGGSWRDHSWESLGGVIQGDPAAVTWGANRIDVYAGGGNIFSLGSQDFVPWHVWFQG